MGICRLQIELRVTLPMPLSDKDGKAHVAAIYDVPCL